MIINECYLCKDNTYIIINYNINKEIESEKVDKLSKIVSSYGNEVNFVYENNKLKRIIFTKENKEIKDENKKRKDPRDNKK